MSPEHREQARATVDRSVHTEMVRTYGLVGRKVVEEEQAGSARAGYGDERIDQLSAPLRADFGCGFTPSKLRSMRLFDLAEPNLLAREIPHAARDKSTRRAGEGGRPAVAGRDPDRGVLNPDRSWTHSLSSAHQDRVAPGARFLRDRDGPQPLAVARAGTPARSTRCSSSGWPRTATRRKGLLRLALKGQEIHSPEDVFKDPLVFEFAGIPESPRLVGSELEEALISNPMRSSRKEIPRVAVLSEKSHSGLVDPR
jgi:hypothetical protein